MILFASQLAEVMTVKGEVTQLAITVYVGSSCGPHGPYNATRRLPDAVSCGGGLWPTRSGSQGAARITQSAEPDLTGAPVSSLDPHRLWLGSRVGRHCPPLRRVKGQRWTAAGSEVGGHDREE